MIRSKASGRASKKPITVSKPRNAARTGFLPSSVPFHGKIHRCFAKAGFSGIRVGINRDWSMVTFWLKHRTPARFYTEKQALAFLSQLLRDGGVNLELGSLAVKFDDDSICGAFTPPERSADLPRRMLGRQ